MRFLRKSDYYRLIQPNDLTVLLSTAAQAGYDPDQLLIDSENGAIELVKSYLGVRYDLDRVFTDTGVYSGSATYYAQNRVQYHETAYSASSTYAIGNRVSYNGSIYSCSTTISAPEAWTAAHWTFVCLDYALFYAKLPYPEFQEFTNYASGTQVWFSDNYTYTAIQNTKGANLNNAVVSEYGADKDGYDNTSRNSQITSTTFWTKSGSKYSFTGQLPTNTTYWTAGDNRAQLLIEHIIDITLYNLYTILVPRNIPQIRMERYNGGRPNMVEGAIGWLKKVSDGSISANLPEKYPLQGISVVFHSGAPKLNNMY